MTLDGELVVDPCEGFTDRARTRPSIVSTLAVTNAWTAVCALRLVDEGNLDRPVAAYWPEFAQGDKGTLAVNALLDHTAGLPAIREILPPTRCWTGRR